jgi:hypothetical protein
MPNFNFSVSIDPRHYVVSMDNRDIEIANLIELFDCIKDYSKILYNKSLDYENFENEGYVNLFNYNEKDVASIALSQIDVEYIESIFGYGVETEYFQQFNIPEKFHPYLLETFNKQRYIYLNTFVLSNYKDITLLPIFLDEEKYIFQYKDSFDDMKDVYKEYLSIPLETNLLNDKDLLKKLFIVISKFWQVDSMKNIIFSSVCMRQLNRNKDINMVNVIESILRGIYFPSYELTQQGKTHDLQIECHPDDSKKIYINQISSPVLRVYVLPLGTRHCSKTLERIFYTKYDDTKAIVIGYDEEHDLNYDLYKEADAVRDNGETFTICKTI